MSIPVSLFERRVEGGTPTLWFSSWFLFNTTKQGYLQKHKDPYCHIEPGIVHDIALLPGSHIPEPRSTATAFQPSVL